MSFTLTLRTTKDRRNYIPPVIPFEMERSQISTSTMTNQSIVHCAFHFRLVDLCRAMTSPPNKTETLVLLPGQS
jgi:hypothetical protein